MKENLDVFDFELSEDEMIQIAALDTGRSCFAQRKTGSEVDAFLKAALNFRV